MGIFAFVYAFVFMGFIYKLVKILKKYVFNASYGGVTYVLLFFYLVFCPLLYSIFSVGSTVVLFHVINDRVSLQWLVPILFLSCGVLLMVLPLISYFHMKPIRVYIATIIALLFGVGMSVFVINPTWNDQLERNLQTSMPSVGLFFMVVSCLVLVFLPIYAKYYKWKDNRMWGDILAEIE